MLEALSVFAIAIAAWVAFTYLFKQRFGSSYIGTPIVSATFFIACTCLIVALFRKEAAVLYGNPPLGSVVFVLAVLLFVSPLLYALARTYGKPRVVEDLELLAIDYRFLIPKAADVLFQQTAFGIFILLLSGAGLPFAILSLIFVILFTLGHVGMFFRVEPLWAGYFLLSSLIFSLPLAWLILFVSGGMYYAIGIHMLWYVIGGFLFGLHRRFTAGGV